ncbi:MAG: hypothetical protein Q8N67_03280 [Candidatus Omnitrophota bacterium]|nr:hypothetical protein [Candidatus Omnitrophota bacterium]
MPKLVLRVIIFCVIIGGCASQQTNYTKKDIVKITDFELSPDEEKIAFSAITPVGNLDIWVVDIDGKNLRKLTFQDRSPTNRIAKFFKKHHWRNFFEIDMTSPKWTADGRILFCQELSKSDMWSTRTVNFMFWTINSDGTNKKPKTDTDKVIQKEELNPIRTFKISDLSDKHKKEIFLKYDTLWYLNYGETTPKRLIQ